MPRPSLKNQRRREILDACITCVARYGIEGATQERIAAEAGIARPLVRHNLGNRAEMIAQLTEHVVAKFDAAVEQIADAAPTLADLVDLVFDPRHRTEPELNLAFQALVAASADNAELRAPLRASLERYVALVAGRVAQARPELQPADRDAVAHGIAAISMMSDSMQPLAPPANWLEASRQAALRLVETGKPDGP